MSGKVNKSKKPSPNKKTIPWDAIRADYVADETITLSVLAKKYGISKSSIGKKSKGEDWKSLRIVSTIELLQKTKDQKAKDILDANQRHLSGSQIIQEATLEGIRRIKDNEVEETVYKRVGKTKARTEVGTKYTHGPVYYSKTLAELVRSYRVAADLERAVLGLATSVQKFGDEDGNEPPVIYDIMGGRANAKRNDDKPASSSSKS